MNAIVVFITAPNRELAMRLARLLVENRMAACVQILPGIVSFYRWQNAIQEDSEILLLVKTVMEKFDALERLVRENHSYEVPEIIAVPATQISPRYLVWLQESTMDNQN